jgi:hypothetical protein
MSIVTSGICSFIVPRWMEYECVEVNVILRLSAARRIGGPSPSFHLDCRDVGLGEDGMLALLSDCSTSHKYTVSLRDIRSFLRMKWSLQFTKKISIHRFASKKLWSNDSFRNV